MTFDHSSFMSYYYHRSTIIILLNFFITKSLPKIEHDPPQQQIIISSCTESSQDFQGTGALFSTHFSHVEVFLHRLPLLSWDIAFSTTVAILLNAIIHEKNIRNVDSSLWIWIFVYREFSIRLVHRSSYKCLGVFNLRSQQKKLVRKNKQMAMIVLQSENKHFRTLTLIILWVCFTMKGLDSAVENPCF